MVCECVCVYVNGNRVDEHIFTLFTKECDNENP